MRHVTPKPNLSWNVDQSGNWDTAANWSTGSVPGASDNVSIDTASLDTVTYRTGSTSILSLAVGNDNFALTGGKLTITNSASFANLLSVSAGTVAVGAGGATIANLKQSGGTIGGVGTITVTGNAVLTGEGTLSGGGTLILEGATTVSADLALSGGRKVENRGTMNWTDGFWQPNTATLENELGATINFKGGLGIDNAKGKNSFRNAGAIVVADKTGNDTVIYVPLTNTGKINVKSGSLEISGGGSSSASAISVASGAVLDFNNSLFFNGPLMNPTFTFTGGTYNVRGQTLVTAGTVDFSAAKIKSFGSQGLTFGGVAGGTVKLGANNVTVSSLTENGDGSTHGDLDGTGIVTVTGQAKFASGEETGKGTTILMGASVVSSALYLGGGRTMENKGNMSVSTDTAIYFSGATFKNDAGGIIHFAPNSGMQAESGTNHFINNGTLVSSGGNISINFAFENSGTLSIGNGGFEAGGNGNQFGGKITGSGAVTFGAPSNVGGQSFLTTVSKLTIAGGVQLSNISIVNQTGNLNISKGEITNTSTGVWTIFDGAKVSALAGVGPFANAGRLEKTKGSGTSTISVPLDNSNTVLVSQGSLAINGAISGNGTLAIQGPATLKLNGAVGKGQSVTFTGKKATLALSSPSTFSAGVKGFWVADTIDFTQFHFSGSEKVSFAENAAKTEGVLTIADGALRAKLTLFGQYAATGFHVASDHASGSAITYSIPPAQDVALAPHGH